MHFFCFKGPKSFLVEGKQAIKDSEVPDWSLAARGFLGGFAGSACIQLGAHMGVSAASILEHEASSS